MPIFPKSFLWGAATSSHQVEGGNTLNDWWKWEQADHVEGKVHSGIAIDHWNRMEEDLDLAEKLGLTSYRFSIEWSRLQPTPDTWSTEALDWYCNLVTQCERRNLVPMATLHHFTSPQWFAEEGGFAAPGAAVRFAQFVERVAKRLASRVPLWCTFNEPLVLVIGQYIGAFMPPAEFSPQKLAASCYEILKAHVFAYDILHSRAKDRDDRWNLPFQVGIAHNMIDFQPYNPSNLWERLLVWGIERYYNRAWLDAITGRRQHFGIPGVLPTPPSVGEARGRRTADFIGLNYYMKLYVQGGRKTEGALGHPRLPLSVCYRKTGDEVSDLGWAIHPQGLSKLIRSLKKYNLPIYITENGIADESDRKRQAFLVSHLKEIGETLAEGIDVRGYYHWSLLDNFEWIKGFVPRFGLVGIDYSTLRREPRESGELYRRMISALMDNSEGDMKSVFETWQSAGDASSKNF